MTMSGQGHFLFHLDRETRYHENVSVVHGAPPYKDIIISSTSRRLYAEDIDWEHYLSEAQLYAEEVEAKHVET